MNDSIEIDLESSHTQNHCDSNEIGAEENIFAFRFSRKLIFDKKNIYKKYSVWFNNKTDESKLRELVKIDSVETTWVRFSLLLFFYHFHVNFARKRVTIDDNVGWNSIRKSSTTSIFVSHWERCCNEDKVVSHQHWLSSVLSCCCLWWFFILSTYAIRLWTFFLPELFIKANFCALKTIEIIDRKLKFIFASNWALLRC